MYKPKTLKIIAVAIVTICILCLSVCPAFAQAVSEHQLKKVLVIYDRRNFFGYTCDEVTSMVQLFYHFKVTVDEIPAASYQKGTLSHYDRVVYIGLADRNLEPALLDDLIKYDRPILFIGRGIDCLIDRKYSNDIVFKGEASGPTKVSYQGKEFALRTGRFFQKINVTGPKGQILSSLGDGSGVYPYVCKISNLWYVSCFSTDEEALFYIVADILHEFFEEYHTDKPKIYVRIEDVHCLRPLEPLYEIADYLAEHKIPFMVALIPAYFDGERDYIYHLNEQEKFAQAVKYMQAAGGSILLHGYTHQIHKSMPGEGFEFWDGEEDCPLDADMGQWVDERINSGLDECIAAGIFPLGFEAPHYAVSQEGYVQLKKYFSTIVGHLQTSDQGFTTTIYPYRLYNSPLYNHLLPENLGYVDPDDPLYKQHIFEELDKVFIVRDFTAGFFFHPYLDISMLKSIIEELKQRDVEFFDLKQEDNWVKGRNHEVYSRSGHIEVANLVEPEEMSPLVSFVGKTVTFLAIIVALLCLRLFIIFLQARKSSKENLFK